MILNQYNKDHKLSSQMNILIIMAILKILTSSSILSNHLTSLHQMYRTKFINKNRKTCLIPKKSRQLAKYSNHKIIHPSNKKTNRSQVLNSLIKHNNKILRVVTKN